jgi:N-acetyl-anhydromuramyl-L-alanine amidase AmpD
MRPARIIPCLLDIHNDIAVDGSTIADRIQKQGKEHLWGERSSASIDTIVIHYTSAVLVDKRRRFDRGLVLRLFCDYGVSSHYLIERSGKILLLVPEEKKAWHCGGSIMPGKDKRTGVNDFSIGIELVATPDSGFTKKQYHRLAGLCRDIEKRREAKFTYVGHQHIADKRTVAAGLRKDIKQDPGRLFDWDLFAGMLKRGKRPLKKRPA